jgi:EAL domain-containing protein (putative c-di-GMP-specific phosphodiesterase class I)
MSSEQFQQKDFIAAMSGIMTKHMVTPQDLMLEITENTIMQSTETASAVLHALTEMGIRLIIDDFGTGYSSLSYLKTFPIHAIKIDRSFVREIGSDPDDAAIATAIISMGHSLRLKVIAEGVESEDQLAFLHKQKCDEIQGFLFSPPIPPEEIAKLLKAENREAGNGTLLLRSLNRTAEAL